MTDHYKDAPADYKHPSDRTSIWERPVPAHDTPVTPVDRAWPKHVHKAAGEFLEVADQAALDAARADGWLLDPPPA